MAARDTMMLVSCMMVVLGGGCCSRKTVELMELRLGAVEWSKLL